MSKVFTDADVEEIANSSLTDNTVKKVVSSNTFSPKKIPELKKESKYCHTCKIYMRCKCKCTKATLLRWDVFVGVITWLAFCIINMYLGAMMLKQQLESKVTENIELTAD